MSKLIDVNKWIEDDKNLFLEPLIGYVLTRTRTKEKPTKDHPYINDSVWLHPVRASHLADEALNEILLMPEEETIGNIPAPPNSFAVMGMLQSGRSVLLGYIFNQDWRKEMKLFKQYLRDEVIAEQKKMDKTKKEHRKQ